MLYVGPGTGSFACVFQLCQFFPRRRAATKISVRHFRAMRTNQVHEVRLLRNHIKREAMGQSLQSANTWNFHALKTCYKIFSSKNEASSMAGFACSAPTAFWQCKSKLDRLF
jgi:hypothetical protein